LPSTLLIEAYAKRDDNSAELALISNYTLAVLSSQGLSLCIGVNVIYSHTASIITLQN